MTLATSRRKRSVAVTLSTVGGLAMLSGCDSPADDFGPPTQVAAYQTVAECVAAGSQTAQQCEAARATALADDAKTAPRFDKQDTCEEQYGAGQCVPRGSQSGGGYFSPLLTGFLVGQMLNGGGGYRYGPLYRNSRDGSYTTGSGGRLIGSGGRYSVGSRALDPVTTQRIQTRSSVVSRGGFGGRATSSGGWGRSGG